MSRNLTLLSIIPVAFITAALAMTTIIGCDSTKAVKVDNPVMGPPPPRVTTEDLKMDARNYAQISKESSSPSSAIQQVAATTGAIASPDRPVQDMQVVAKVNGVPILASEVLDRYSIVLNKAKQEATPQQFDQLRLQIIKKDLPSHVERTLLVESLKQTLDNEQLASLDQQLDAAFEDRMKEMMAKAKVNNRRELNEKLSEQGATLAHLRQEFGNQQLALQFLSMKASTNVVFSRTDLLKHYKENLEDYSHPARVEWSEIIVKFLFHGGKSQAAEVVRKAIRDLQNGEEFGEVAKSYSDGPTALQGGSWGWTQYESIAEPKLVALLKTLPVGETSEVLIMEDAFRILKITNREKAHVTPFGEVQEEIKQAMMNEFRAKNTEKVLDQLRENAVIETMFDQAS